MKQVASFFQRLFDTSDWPPRWHCGQWTAFHGWLYIISDLLIWSAYFTIPVIIIRYITRKTQARFIRIYYLFAAFILSCGATHFLDAAAFWVPAYRLSALVRFITALLSWLTVFALVRQLPALFSLKSPKELEAEILSYKYALDESCIVAITDQKGIIQHVNDNFCRISKYEAGELIGQDHRIINSGHHAKAFIRELWVTIANGKIWKGELCNRAKDGTLYWVDTTIVPFLNAQGKPYRYMAIRADITERKRAEQEVKDLNESLERKIAERTRELQASNKELEAFSYSISHDLRAPLRAINGFASILEEEYAPHFDDNGRRLLHVIEGNARQMGLLIDSLLDFCRLGRTPLQKSRVDMAALVRAILTDLGHSPGHRADITVGPLHGVQADSALIRQVLVNYISNAIKYSAKSPNPHIDIRSDAAGGRIVYSVSDNGAGFDMQYAHKLFGVFQRLHNPREFEGTGVGLAIVKRIVERHGGEVWAEAEPGKGATFYFSLPV